MSAFDAIPSLLSHLTTPDTAVIRRAEASLKPLLKDPACVAHLMGSLRNPAAPAAVRQVAAVILCKRIGAHYMTFQAQTKAEFRAVLLSCLQNEPERSVRRTTVSAVAKLASIEITGEGNNWPEVLPFIASATSAPAPEARELAFFLLEEMTATVGECLQSSFQNLAGLYNSALQDPDQKVKTAALKSLGMLMAYLVDEEESLTIFSGLIPLVLQTASGCRQLGDEDTLQVINDVLYDLCHSSSRAVNAHLPATVQFCLSELADVNLELVTRDSAALVISTLTEVKPKFMAKKVDVPSLLDTFIHMIEVSSESAAGAFFDNNPAWREDTPDDSDDDDNYDGPTQCGIAQGCLDVLACNLPQKSIFQPAVERCVVRMQSSSPPSRKAGVASLGVVAEGCAERLSQRLGDVAPYVIACAGDADEQVRECACFALGQLAEHCQPEILTFAPQILEAVFRLLDDTSVSVQTTSCYVLEMFCEHLEPEQINRFLDPLTRKLVSMLEVATRKCVREMAVAALAATAVAAEKEFIPYLPAVANIMGRLMVLNTEDQYPLKGRAMECMGHMAVAVEKDAFRPYFQETMRCTCEALTLDSVELHEYAYAVFANLSKVMEREFSPVLPELVPHMWKLIGQSDGQGSAKDQKEIQDLLYSRAPKDTQFSGLDDSDEEQDPDGVGALDAGMFVTTAMLEAKKAAITALGEMASHCGQDFMPFIEESANVLKEAGTYWHPSIKLEVCRGYPSLVVCSVAAHHPDGKVPWEKGNLQANPMSPHTNALAGAVLAEVVPLLMNPEQEVVSGACEAIASVIELCGPASLIPVANDVLQGVLRLLSKSAPCQEEDREELDDDDDDDEHENFMNAVTDLLGSIARVMGPQLAQFLPQFLGPLSEYCKPSRPANDRSMAIGCLGELAQAMGQSALPHWQAAFFPAVMAGLADPEHAVQRNAAFAAGVCAESFGEAVAPQYQQILQALHPLFSIDASTGDSAASCVDNAAAALARMCMAAPAAMPLQQVLPIFLRSLPLKSDMMENETVYSALVKMHREGQADLRGPLQGEVKRVVGEALRMAKVEDEVKEQLRAEFGGGV